MAQRMSTRYTLPEVRNPLPLVKTIERLRKEIGSECSMLRVRAREIDASEPRNPAFRRRYWESMINEISSAQMATHSVDELKGLKMRCKLLLGQMEQFRR